METTPLIRLKEVIHKQIQHEIFYAEEALGVYLALSEESDFLNSSSYRHVFGIIQHQALGALIISLCKLFEKQNGQYPNYSIPTALNLIENSLEYLDIPVESAGKLRNFIRSITDNPEFELFYPNNYANESAKIILNYFKEQCPSSPPKAENKFNGILESLKVLRDKRIAHHEEHNLLGLPTTEIKNAIELLSFAKTFFNIIGYGFLGFSTESIVQPTEFSTENLESGIEMKEIIHLIRAL